MGKDNISGKKKYNNGSVAKYFIPGEQPEGWILGSTKEKKLKNSIASKKLWQDKDFKEKYFKTTSTPEFHEKRVKINKQIWQNYSIQEKEERCKNLAKGAQNRWNKEEERNKASNKMIEKWSEQDYRQNQEISIKKGHLNLYINHPEIGEKLSLKVKEAWNKNKESILKKQHKTKSQNKSWNTSKLEEAYYKSLITLYGEEDIIRQYRDERYPFYCDFYIKSLDMFIEIQGTWCHGGHEFNPLNIEDCKTLAIWKNKAKTSKYFEKAVEVWTITDPLKKEIALKNNLNIKFIYYNK